MPKFLRPLFLGLAVCLLGAIPASASAGILYSGASEVAAGTGIVGTEVGANPYFKSGPNIFFECSGANLSGTVTGNTSTAADITVESLALTGPGSEGRCLTSAGEVKVTMDAPACLRRVVGPGSEWYIRGNSCTTASRTGRLTLVYNTIGTCHYHSLLTTGSYQTKFTSNINSEPLILTQAEAGQEFERDSGSGLCASLLTLKGLRLELKTSSGGGLKVTS